jgi:16S rRNA (cytosine967-C5)-methyltransferase
MNPRIAANQLRTFHALLAQVLPHVGRDSALPRRIKELLSRNRALGSRDRRLYRELTYTALRFLPWIKPVLARDADRACQLVAWLAPELKDTAAYRAALLTDWPAVPATLAEKAAALRAVLPEDTFAPESLLPAWLRAECPAAFEAPHLDAILARAPLWIRIQTRDHTLVLDELARHGWPARASADLPDAYALPPNAEVAASDAYRRGFVEIQDLGSQLVLAHAPVRAGERWLDACAGAGGKTLQLAHAVGDTGRVDAADIRPAMLEELRDRATRARLANVRITNFGGTTNAAGPKTDGLPAGGYDGVLVDAPCSGTGTWRRLPHMKWHTQPAMLAEFAATQLAILREQAPRVRPGGLLVYATCSLARTENHDVVAAFLAAAPEFAAERPTRDFGGGFDDLGTTLLPGTRDSDGFYVALLRRRGGA